MGRNLPKTCDICFKTMRGDHLKRHMLKHVNGRMERMKKVEECYIRMVKCHYCNYTSNRSFNMRRHMLKHVNGRMEEKECEKQVLRVEQNYEMIRKNLHMQCAESKRKI